MPKPRKLALTLTVLFSSLAAAQAPTDGRIDGKSYVNTYLHVAYSWPAMLTPKVLPPSQPENKDSGRYVFPLLTARQGDQPYGIVVVAEKLNVAGPHSTGIRDSAEFIERIKTSLRPGPVLSNIASSRRKSARGLVFDELDYLQNGQPAAVMATQIDKYLIVFRCNAQSAADMARMQTSALALRKLK